MLRAIRWSLIPGLFAACLLAPAAADASALQVHDNGNFFKKETVDKANGIIKRVADNYQKNVLVETFGEIPQDVAAKYKLDLNSLGTDQSTRFFRAWRDELVRKADANGILIMMVRYQAEGKNKAHLEVAAGANTLKNDFTHRDIEKLDEILAKNFAKNPDGRLLEGLDFVEKTVGANHKRSPAATAPAQRPTTPRDASAGPDIMGWICIGVAVLAGIWLIFGLIRAFSGGGGYAAGPGGAPGGYGYGGGGGGFFSGLMGGLFGAMAGSWLYNNMFGGSHGSSWGGSTAYGSQPNPGAKDDFNAPDHGEGFAGTSRDIDMDGGGDKDGGGGDWGGGEGQDAGGDWGGGGGGDGGDWGGGGGGGDWGGGGGGGGGDW